jgi:hypothetical protein
MDLFCAMILVLSTLEMMNSVNLPYTLVSRLELVMGSIIV